MRVVLREFQRHMHRYLAIECEVCGTKGNYIGRWEPKKENKSNEVAVDILEEEEV